MNCAAYTAVDKAEEDKALCAAVNVDAVKNLAVAADSLGAKIIHISTDYVFDGKTWRPYRESDKVNHSVTLAKSYHEHTPSLAKWYIP